MSENSVSVEEMMNSGAGVSGLGVGETADRDDHIAPQEDESIPADIELDVQKVVVEELAAEKAALELKANSLEEQLQAQKSELEKLSGQLSAANSRIYEFEKNLAAGKAREAELERKLDSYKLQESDIQSRNPNQLALLDRDVEMPDRFPGETRDHILEIIAEARDQAERDGRRRRAQLLESVLKANEPSGNLQKKRDTFVKFMDEHHNVLTGEVIAELEKYGITYREGGQNLLLAEIITRTY